MERSSFMPLPVSITNLILVVVLSPTEVVPCKMSLSLNSINIFRGRIHSFFRFLCQSHSTNRRIRKEKLALNCSILFFNSHQLQPLNQFFLNQTSFEKVADLDLLISITTSVVSDDGVEVLVAGVSMLLL